MDYLTTLEAKLQIVAPLVTLLKQMGIKEVTLAMCGDPLQGSVERKDLARTDQLRGLIMLKLDNRSSHLSLVKIGRAHV